MVSSFLQHATFDIRIIDSLADIREDPSPALSAESGAEYFDTMEFCLNDDEQYDSDSSGVALFKQDSLQVPPQHLPALNITSAPGSSDVREQPRTLNIAHRPVTSRVARKQYLVEELRALELDINNCPRPNFLYEPLGKRHIVDNRIDVWQRASPAAAGVRSPIAEQPKIKPLTCGRKPPMFQHER